MGTQAKQDLEFLKEMRERFEAFLAGDDTEGEMVIKMIDDWIHDLDLETER